MGDRCTIQFKTGDDKSVTFYAHWDGYDAAATAETFARELVRQMPTLREMNGSVPLTRYEPDIVMLNFIRKYFQYVQNDWIPRSYALMRDYEEDCDAGHHVIEFFPDTDTWVRHGDPINGQ